MLRCYRRFPNVWRTRVERRALSNPTPAPHPRRKNQVRPVYIDLDGRDLNSGAPPSLMRVDSCRHRNQKFQIVGKDRAIGAPLDVTRMIGPVSPTKRDAARSSARAAPRVAGPRVHCAV
jgi:hypothetical protein